MALKLLETEFIKDACGNGITRLVPSPGPGYTNILISPYGFKLYMGKLG